jgi:lipoate-protein ligase B
MVIYTANLGLCEYRQALRVQHALHARCLRDQVNALVLTEHFPVLTLGYRRRPDHLRLSSDELTRRGVAVIETERGGSVTYHGPGQLVAYPIFSSLLRRLGVRKLIFGLEEVLCRVSQHFGAPASRRAGFPGVWVGLKKLGAVGIAVRRGVSLHGCALNVNVDLQPFSYIDPCGLADIESTSVQQEIGTVVPMSDVLTRLRAEWAAVFAATLEEMPNEWLHCE